MIRQDTPTAQAKAFAPYLANWDIYWGSRTAAYPIKHRLTRCLFGVFHVKRLLIALFLFIVAVTNTFGETVHYRIFECSDEFRKIKEDFRERLYNACLDYNFFYYEKNTFDIENGTDHPLDTNAKKLISSIKTKYFIFKDFGAGVYFMFLVNKEDRTAIRFYFFDGGLESSKPSSRAEIDKTLSLFLEL